MASILSRPQCVKVNKHIWWWKVCSKKYTLSGFVVFWFHSVLHMPWASYQIRKIAGCACARNAGNVFPHCRFQRKPLVSDPGMHHGTCVTHVPWCMSGSLTCGDGENVPGIPGACAPAILRIWQEAHWIITHWQWENHTIILWHTSEIEHPGFCCVWDHSCIVYVAYVVCLQYD